jgi:hypothetical protein
VRNTVLLFLLGIIIGSSVTVFWFKHTPQTKIQNPTVIAGGSATGNALETQSPLQLDISENSTKAFIPKPNKKMPHPTYFNIPSLVFPNKLSQTGNAWQGDQKRDPLYAKNLLSKSWVVSKTEDLKWILKNSLLTKSISIEKISLPQISIHGNYSIWQGVQSNLAQVNGHLSLVKSSIDSLYLDSNASLKLLECQNTPKFIHLDYNSSIQISHCNLGAVEFISSSANSITIQQSNISAVLKIKGALKSIHLNKNISNSPIEMTAADYCKYQTNILLNAEKVWGQNCLIAEFEDNIISSKTFSPDIEWQNNKLYSHSLSELDSSLFYDAPQFQKFIDEFSVNIMMN